MYFVLPLLALGMVGLILVPVAALCAGSAAASLVDSRRGLNTTIVVATTALVFSLYLIQLQSQPPAPGTSRGGPSVYPPPGALHDGSAPSSQEAAETSWYNPEVLRAPGP